MSETHLPAVLPSPPKVIGLLADFADGDALIQGVLALRKAGYKRLDAFTPFPIHGIDDALGLKPTHLPWLVFGAGLTGTATAVGMQYFTNAVDYPFRISGKPLFSMPASVPIGFELTILFAAFGAFFGMLILNRLWSFYNPVLETHLFRRVTNDRFVLSVSAADPLFNAETTAALVRTSGAHAVQTVSDETTPIRLPRLLWLGLSVLLLLLLIPPFLIAKARATKSEDYPIRLELGMRNQDKVKSQTLDDFFENKMAMRRPLPGTVAHGDTLHDDPFNEGIDNGKYVTAFPLPVSKELMARGQERFNIYCSACHGLAGLGNGTVAQRAELVQKGGDASTWVKPMSLSDPKSPVRDMTDGQIFHTITYGVRNMKGYGYRVPAEDRWAIVLYVRALQKSQLVATDAPAPK